MQTLFRFVLFVTAFLVFRDSALIAQVKTGLDLNGVVVDAEKKPVAGATVWIYTAGPRVGRGYL